MNKKIIAVLLCVCMIFAFAACGAKTETEEPTKNAAASDLAYIKDKGTLIVGITDFAPMDYKEKADDKEWIGFDADLGKAVAKDLGVNIEFKEITWSNKWSELNSKSIDCVWNGMTITDEVKNNSAYSKPYAMNAQVVVMAKDSLDKYASVESIKGLKFAAEEGSAGESQIKETILGNDEALIKKQYTAVKAQSDALLEVKSGSADACVIDRTMANAMTGEGTSMADLGYKLVLSEEEYGISFRTGSDALEAVEKLFDKYREDGTMKTLSEKYSVELAK